MRDNYFGGSTPRVVDYRNARYQGLLNSSDKRHGFGIVLDDNMSLYCSEWAQGLMDGMTFIYLNNTILYGHWKQGQPHGLNVFTNTDFTAYIYFYQGSPCRQAMIVDNKLSHLVVINGETISKKDQLETEITSYQRIIKADVFQQILMLTSQKIGLLLERHECSPKAFLNHLSARYSQLVNFNSINAELQYFGFDNGIGFNFSTASKKKNRMEMISLGHHNQERLTQIGIKYHASGCLEEGNFSNKETISYSKHRARPQDKCELIYQHVHKKSLNFINQYWDFKVSAIDIIEDFLEQKFTKKFQELISASLQPPAQNKKDLPTDRQQFYKQAREDYLKAAGHIRTKLQRNKSRPSLSPNQSIKKIASKEKHVSKINNQVIKHSRKHRDCYPKAEPQPDLRQDSQQQIHELVDRLRELRRKKQTNCEKCKSRERPRSNKKSKPKEGKKSVSGVSRETKEKSERVEIRQPKYLKNYPYQQDRSVSALKNKSKMTEGQSPIKRIPSKSGIVKERSHSRLEEAQRQKSQIRYENELRIRQQLFQEQQKRSMKQMAQLEEYHSNRIYQSSLSQQFDYHLPAPVGKENIRVSPPAISNSRYKVDHFSGCRQVDRPKGYYRQMLNPLSSIPQLQNLEDRRARLLLEFKQMNRDLSEGLLAPRFHEDRSMGSMGQDYYNHSLRHLDTMKTDLILSGHVDEGERDNRRKIEQFNRKYRNLLQQQPLKPAPLARLSPKPFMVSDEDYRISQHQPDISSFNYLGQQLERYQNIPSKKSKYQYYF